MLSSFTQTILFLVLLVSGLIYATPFKNNVCNVKINDESECFPFVIVPQNCKSARLNLSKTFVAKSCNAVNLFWNYPQNNLTVIIETPFTQKRQAYSIHLPNQLDMQLPSIHQVCPTGELTKLKSQNGTITVKSDAKYQVVLQLQAPTLQLFGVMIDYKVIKN